MFVKSWKIYSFFYVNAKDEETLVYNEYQYKLGFADAMKMKNEIVEIER